MNNRAQLTIFIILGLIILLSIGLVIYFTSREARAPLERAITVPEDVQQIYDAVVTCTRDLTREGLEILGQQSGYIEIPQIIARTPSSYVALDEFGTLKTPYWYFEGEDRTPSLETITRELQHHIKNNLAECVDEFRAFAPVFEVTPTGNILPVISITDDRVIVNVNWPLDIQTTERRTQMTDFVTSHTVRLKPIHELASAIMKAENEQEWFENLTLDLMSANSRIPLSGMEFSCGTKKWYLPEVRNELRNLLAYNLPTVRVANTQNTEPIASERTYERLKDQAETIRAQLEAGAKPNWPRNVPDDVYEINRMTLDAGVRDTTLKAAFTYPLNGQLFLNADPARGGILSTENMKGPRKYLRFVCLNQWHFTYDLIYPIKVSIRDDDAFNGEGYVFNYAFPVIIKDNEPSRIFFGLREFRAPPLTTEFCTSFGDRTIDVRARGFVEGSPIAEELDGVNVTYRCLNQECLLGQTYSDGSGAIRLFSYLPEGCNAPLIIGQKEGYLSSEQQATENRVDLSLTKLKKLNYSIQVHPYYEEVSTTDPMNARAQRWLDSQIYTRLPKTMHATVSLSLRGKEFDQYLLYPANLTQFSSEESGLVSEAEGIARNELWLVHDDAQYDLDILLFKGDTPVGGYHAENITLKYEDLATADNIVFHVMEYRPLPEKPHQQAGLFLFLHERGQYEGTPYATALRPTFI